MGGMNAELVQGPMGLMVPAEILPASFRTAGSRPPQSAEIRRCVRPGPPSRISEPTAETSAVLFSTGNREHISFIALMFIEPVCAHLYGA